MKIVHENSQYVVVDKPSGWLSRTSRQGMADSRPVVFLELQKSRPDLFVVHRLDFETSGLLIYAKNPTAHRLLQMAFEHRTIRKFYRALTEGQYAQGDQEWQTWTSVIAVGKRRSFFSPHGLLSETLARYLGEVFIAGERFLKWELELKTGRRHQIRLELSSRGFLVVGDQLYGAKPLPLALEKGRIKNGIALCATRIEFLDSQLRKELDLPEYFDLKNAEENTDCDSFWI